MGRSPDLEADLPPWITVDNNGSDSWMNQSRGKHG